MENISYLIQLECLFYGETPDHPKGFQTFCQTEKFSKSLIELFVDILEKMMFIDRKFKTTTIMSFSYILKAYSDHITDHLQNNSFEYYKENIILIERILKFFSLEENLGDLKANILGCLLQIVVGILGFMNIDQNKGDVEEIHERLLLFLWEIADIRMSNDCDGLSQFKSTNFVYFEIIIERILKHYDENLNLQKISLELKIKGIFWDEYLKKMIYRITKKDFISNKTMNDEFYLNGILFNKVFNQLCHYSEDQEFILLRNEKGSYIFLINHLIKFSFYRF